MPEESIDKTKSIVSIISCSSYQQEEVNKAVEEVLKPLEPLAIPEGSRILLKPNCLSSNYTPDKEVNTRVEILEAVGRYLIENYQVRLVITDSSGMGNYGRSRKAFEVMGLIEAAERLGAELVDIDGRDRGLAWYKSSTALRLPEFQATDLLRDVDAVINLPKMKTHPLTGMTGAIKNCMGLLPGGLKRNLHVNFPTALSFSEALVDIYSVVKPALNIMDAVISMEGDGPNLGTPKKTGKIIASTDGAALDYVASRIMRFASHQVYTIKPCSIAEIGNTSKDGIELVGENWSDLPVKDFKNASRSLKSFLYSLLPPKLAGKIVNVVTEAKPKPNSNCDKCGNCVKACPAEALYFENQKLSINKKRCIECYCCLEHCSNHGLRVPQNIYERIRTKPKGR